jgi:hypothetical protein
MNQTIEPQTQTRLGFWITASVIAAPLYYLVIIQAERKDEVSAIGWMLGYIVMVFLAAWLLNLAKLILGSKIGRLAVLAYLTLAFVAVVIIPFFSGKLDFNESGVLGLLIAIFILIKGISLLFETWEDEIKK